MAALPGEKYGSQHPKSCGPLWSRVGWVQGWCTAEARAGGMPRRQGAWAWCEGECQAVMREGASSARRAEQDLFNSISQHSLPEDDLLNISRNSCAKPVNCFLEIHSRKMASFQ